MFRLFLLFFLCVPAFAAESSTWLVFESGATTSNVTWQSKTAPVAGVNVPAGSTVVPFVTVNGDSDPRNYSLVAGALTHK